MLRGHSHPCRGWISILRVVLVLPASRTSCATDALERYGAKKLGAIASACERTAAAWSRWVSRRDGQDAMPVVSDDDYRRTPAYFGVRARLPAIPRA